jgi:hypothetical protein
MSEDERKKIRFWAKCFLHDVPLPDRRSMKLHEACTKNTTTTIPIEPKPKPAEHGIDPFISLQETRDMLAGKQ